MMVLYSTPFSEDGSATAWTRANLLEIQKFEQKIVENEEW